MSIFSASVFLQFRTGGDPHSDISLLCIVFFCLNRGSIVQNRGTFVLNRGQTGDLLWSSPTDRGMAGEARLTHQELSPDYAKVSSDISLLCIVFFCLNRGSIVQNRGSFVPNRGQAGDLLWCVPPNRGTAGELLFYENNRVTSPSLPNDSILAAQIKG